jgi:hypothetical protein
MLGALVRPADRITGEEHGDAASAYGGGQMRCPSVVGPQQRRVA